MASEVEPPCVSIAEKQRVAPLRARNTFLLIECNVRYAAWLLRPQALGAPVAMTRCWEFVYTNKGTALACLPATPALRAIASRTYQV
jgi:hypothetical protein